MLPVGDAISQPVHITNKMHRKLPLNRCLLTIVSFVKLGPGVSKTRPVCFPVGLGPVGLYPDVKEMQNSPADFPLLEKRLG